MGKKKYTFGKLTGIWKEDKSQTVTFVVTDDCNLRCKYCYITHKSPNKQMNFETAKEFFKDNELSFFGARFYEKFNSKDEISNLQYASKTLVDFIISNYSIDDLISGRMDFEKIKPWFEKHNIDSKYQESIDKFMNVFEFSSSNLKPLIMKSEKLSYTVLNIDPQWDRANKIETFIVHDKDDRNKIHKIIKDEAPRFYDEFLKGKVDSIALNYELNKSKKGSFADKNLDNKIYLGSLSANTHEYIHILLANRLDFVNWLHEGLAQYFPFLYFDEPVSSYIEFINYDVELFAKERSLTEKEKQEFLRMRNTVIDNFTNRGGVWPIDNNVKDDKQRRLFMDAFAYYELKLDDYFTVSEVYGDRINLTRDKTGTFLEADELSYLQALSFTNYLIGNFGLEKMLYISQESPSAVSFEEDFGKSYGELKKDWLNSIGF